MDRGTCSWRGFGHRMQAAPGGRPGRRGRTVVSLALALATAAGVAGTAGLTGAAVATGATPQLALRPLALLHGVSAPKLPAGSVALGRVPARSQLHLTVALRLGRPAALQRFLSELTDRSSPLFHHFLRRGQFGPEFGLSSRVVREVESVLHREGLSVTKVAADRLSIDVKAPAGAIERAFSVSLDRFRLPSGRVAFANAAAPHLPASVAPYIVDVAGLDDVQVLHDHLARPTVRPGAGSRVLPARMRAAVRTTGPRPCSAATSAASSFGSFTADQLAAYYGMTPLYDLGDLGQGVHVALVEFEPNLPSDIAAYQSCYGTSATVNYVGVDGGAGTGAGSGEAALDIEDVIGLAPQATVDVYQAPNSGSATLDLYTQLFNADTDPVVSTSWGLCELASDPAALQAEQTLFEQANSQGQTVFAAAGDTGSTDCVRTGDPSIESSLAVDDPGSQPLVVSVGGTSIGKTTEKVWNDSGSQSGAGGGGISAFWCMPKYQDVTAIPGLENSNSVVDTKDCSAASTDALIRQAPDVSADADPNTGYTIFYTGSASPVKGWLPIGGTSAAAPLWAAAAALIDSSPFCTDYASGRPGVLPQVLYDLAGVDASYIYKQPNGGYEALYDVQSGNDDYTPSGYLGGLFPAGFGYDMASGLGTPQLTGLTGSLKASNYFPGLAALICHALGTQVSAPAVTGISPALGPSAGGAQVTITGSGFLTIPGADEVKVGSHMVPASCTTATTCTAVMPATPAGTVDLRMGVEDFALSAATSADRFTFVARPVLTKLSPKSGSPAGGTTVLIFGQHLSGATAVHFGGRLATHLVQVSATELKVTSPHGSGTVHVTVTTAGGTSAVTSAGVFRY